MIHPKYEKWPYKKVLPEHVPILIQRYQAGESARKICLDLPFEEDVAIKVLRDFDIPIKTRKENRFSMGFSINENAFLDLAEPECAYFYGWLLTDGNITKRKYGYQVSVQIKDTDSEILYALSNYIGNGCDVKFRERFDKRTNRTYKSCSYSFSNHTLVQRLQGIGLEESKSLRETAPKEFLQSSHFWRGVFEGDGYLSRPNEDLKLQICGSEQLCNQWKDYCQSVCSAMKVSVKELRNGLWFTYSGRSMECKKILDSLYLGVPENMRLTRKYKLYIERYYNGIDPG